MKSLKLFTFFFTALLLWGAGSTNAQNRKTAAADQAFETNQYNTAIKLYRKAAGKVKDINERNRIAFQQAECFRMMNDRRKAEPFYRRLVNAKYETTKPEILLHLADILRSKETYEEAKELYERYIALVPDDHRGTVGLESCELAPQLKENPSRHEITPLNSINSRDNDFSAVYSNSAFNEIVFASDRKGVTGKKLDEWTNKGFSDLFITKNDVTGKWTTPITADAGGMVNTEANEGQPFFNPRFNTMYFTRCYNEKKKKNGCKVMVTKRAGTGWSEPTEIDLGGDSTTVIGHPTLTDDELTIVFSAELPGGRGGKDLWMANRKRKTDKFGKPRNLGDIVNTPGNELFPYLRADTLLYFSSDGHAGMGGLDIFKTWMLKSSGEETKENWKKPQNLSTPINSNSDDFAISFHAEAMEEGFFTSNRVGGRGGDDIYSFVIQPLVFTLQGIVRDDRTLQPVQGALVVMEGSDGKSYRSTTSEIGAYSFNKNQVLPNTNYKLTVSKEKYFTATGEETTLGLETSKDLVHDFRLIPVPQKPVVLPDILYDLGRWELKPQYQDSLQGLIQILEANPNIIIELAAHTDARDSEERNDALSQKRAQSVVDYLIVRGIEPGRLSAKGYGERQPRVLQSDVVKEGYTFKAGSRLTEAFIDSLSGKQLKEAAHQMNRRTEFSIIATNFVSQRKVGQPLESQQATEVKIVTEIEKHVVPYTTKGKEKIVACTVNNITLDFIYSPKAPKAVISTKQALELLKAGAIGKDDFQGNGEEILAGGSIQNNAVFTISQLRIGRKVIYDVDVTVDSKADGLIINNKVLSRFGAFVIDEKASQLIFE
ncbi:MAG: OmpA family protein [Bacteroidales bacterium]|nr:OmpA family protein [Bacteroidales bacterium]MDD3665192.1 OmpA family protein [Bacteroidales bacterium]